MIEAVVAGHLCLDIIPDLSSLTPGQFDASFLPGRLVQCGAARLSTGGAVANTGIALHRLGIDTRLIAGMGDDPLGMLLRQCVNAQGEGLGKDLLVKAGSSTSYSIVISPPGTDRRFLHNPGANDDFSDQDVNMDLVKDARLFHFGYPPVMARMYSDEGRQLQSLFRRVKDAGLTTSLDMTFPDPDSPAGKADWVTILKNVLPYVDVFVPSFDEIAFMLWKKMDIPLSREKLAEISGQLLSMGARMVMIKLGNRGLYLHCGSRSSLNGMGKAAPNKLYQWADFEAWLPCYSVEVVGTTGSGDVTIAGFLASLLRGLTPVDALNTALAVGACCVEAADALSGILPWDKTLERINTGWNRRIEPDQFLPVEQ